MPGVGGLVHGVEVEGGLQLGLSTGQEHDARDGRGDTAAQHLQGVVSNLLGTGPAAALCSGGNHGRLQQDTLEQNTIVSQVLEGLSPSHLSHFKGAVDVVITVQEDFGLDNGDQTGVLGNGSVTSETVSAVANGDGRGASRDGNDGAPLGKASTSLVVLGAALGKSVKTRAPRFAIGVGKRVETLVNLDTRNDALLVQAVHHALATADVLEQSLLEQDGSGDVLAKTGCGHEQFAVSLAVFHGVLEADGFEALPAGGVGLVHGQDTLSRGGDLPLRRKKV